MAYTQASINEISLTILDMYSMIAKRGDLIYYEGTDCNTVELHFVDPANPGALIPVIMILIRGKFDELLIGDDYTFYKRSADGRYTDQSRVILLPAVLGRKLEKVATEALTNSTKHDCDGGYFCLAAKPVK